MAKLATIASGNWTSSGTWCVIDPTLYANSESFFLTLPTTYGSVGRSAQATPGAITVSHIGIKLGTRSATTGTMTVHIADSSHVEVAGTAVTINTADLPTANASNTDGGWHFLKLASPVTLSAATLYEVEAKVSVANEIVVFGSATTAGMSCALITTTMQAPAAGDDMIINGEYTGAGTSNAFTVTMNETATTDYGSGSTSLVIAAVGVSNLGTLAYGTSASTNYFLKVSGNVIVYSGGTFTMGKSGSEIPRGSTAKLYFDCVSNVDFGLVIRNNGTFKAYGLSRTSGKDIWYCKLTADVAANGTTFNVDTDTGWLSGDRIAIASTTRTPAQTEDGTLNGNAGASSMTVNGFTGTGGGVLYAHSGTSPCQAEIVLLTRNVSIYSVSTSVNTYMTIAPTATVDCKWAEFYYMGSATTAKRGIEFSSTAGSVTFDYCSRHSSTVSGSKGFVIAAVGTSSGLMTISNCAIYNINNYHIDLGAITSGYMTITGNIAMKTNSTSAHIFNIADIGSTITNNTTVGSFNVSAHGFNLTESQATLGTFTGNTAHSNAGAGLGFSSSVFGGTVGTFTAWRNNLYGIRTFVDASVISSIKFTTGTLVGNATNISLSSGSFIDIMFDNYTLAGDTSFSVTNGVDIASNNNYHEARFVSCDFSTATGIKTAHTNDFNFSGGVGNARITCINTKLGAATEVANQASLMPDGYVAMQKNDQTTGAHKILRKYGTISRDTVTVHTGSQSIKMTPINASNKLESCGKFGGFKVAVANGATVTPTVYVYEDASYNGARARLIVKRNDALGITSDTVLKTATAASDAAWEALSGTTAAVTDDGTLEFVVDCDGTAGNLYVDSFSVA